MPTFILALICNILVSARDSNPFKGKKWYIEPTYYDNVQHTIDIYPEYSPLLQKAQNISTFFWLNSTASINNMSKILDDAKHKSDRHNRSYLVQFVLYNIPNRDCSEDKSNGDIICQNEECEQGIQEYQNKYIDPMINIFKRYPNLTIIIVIEPHALPNLAIHGDMEQCQIAKEADMSCISYAIQKLFILNNTYLYIAAGNGALLGMKESMNSFVSLIKAVLSDVGSNNKIHGFATNIGTYQPLNNVTSKEDPCDLERVGNVCINEVIYIQYMDLQMNNAGIKGMYYITDTSHNGQSNTMQPPPCNRIVCNDYETGLHFKPNINTSSTGIGEAINAFCWISIPGVSEGGSGSDTDFCSDPNAIKPSPTKGDWFPQYFVSMCKKSNPPLQ